MKRRFEIGEELGQGYVREVGSGLRWHRDAFRVLYADTDQSGVVYHANYLKYFEIGRAALIRASGRSYKDIERLGVFQPIVDLALTFQSYAGYDELLSVYARPKEIAPVKFGFEYVIRDDDKDRVLVYGNTIHCCVDKDKKVMPVDPVTRRIFADHGVTHPNVRVTGQE